MKNLKVKGIVELDEEGMVLTGCKVYISPKEYGGVDISIFHPELGFLESEYWEFYEDAVKSVEESVRMQFGDDVLLDKEEE